MAKLRFDPTNAFSFEGDPREVPTYSISEAAHYVRIPKATLRSWLVGRDYPTGSGKRRFKPLISLADPTNCLLSFVNLAEAHVLSACRRTHQIPVSHLRTALDFLARKFGSKHPLVDHEFETNGVNLFVEHLGKLIDATANGQIVMGDVVRQHLQRLERENNFVIRLYPFTRPTLADTPRSVLIDPRIAFGRPVLAAARIPTLSLAERYTAGESIDHLAEDYGCERLEVEEALRCEMRLDAAA